MACSVSQILRIFFFCLFVECILQFDLFLLLHGRSGDMDTLFIALFVLLRDSDGGFLSSSNAQPPVEPSSFSESPNPATSPLVSGSSVEGGRDEVVGAVGSEALSGGSDLSVPPTPQTPPSSTATYEGPREPLRPIAIPTRASSENTLHTPRTPFTPDAYDLRPGPHSPERPFTPIGPDISHVPTTPTQPTTPSMHSGSNTPKY